MGLRICIKTLGQNKADTWVNVLNGVKIAVQDFGGKTVFIFPFFSLKKSIRTNRTINIAFYLY